MVKIDISYTFACTTPRNAPDEVFGVPTRTKGTAHVRGLTMRF